ncbi:3'-5' exonuclease family protein [Evansella halocellulosilytica]|uniref:hypothetical protein n=1 Tax=Evansella halocellulosilytica TaxID=2011013 RepID=UPI000BB6ABA1|nr:hypothetical protein [Evansella halocellulosilytica]
MRGIVIEIDWLNLNKGQTSFYEMTEIAVKQIEVVDGLLIDGGTFHSFIRPVFSHWKKKKAIDPHFSEWWLAPTFPHVMKRFENWLGSIGKVPWIFPANEAIEVWVENAKRHDYMMKWPAQCMTINNESHARIVRNRTKKQIIARLDKRIKGLKDHLLSDKYEIKQFHLEHTIQRKRDPLIVKVLHLIETNDVTLANISEWGEISELELNMLLSGKEDINSFQKEKLEQALTLWESIGEFEKKWLQ